MRGHADDMISRLKNNAILQRRYRERHQRMYDALTNEFENHHLNNPQISKEQRDAIKAKIRKSIIRERRLAMIKTLSITAVIITIILLIFLQNAQGQGIVSEENSWNIIARDLILNDADTEFQIIDGDTTVDGLDYKIMWFSYYTIGDWHQSGLIREDSGIVYFIRPDGLQGVLYNFNLEAGDTCTIVNFCLPYKLWIHIQSVDTVEYFGVERLRLSLVDNMTGYTDEWIQGIGSIHGPIHSFMQHCNPPYLRWDLLCYHHNDTLQYIMPGYTECIYTHTGIDEHSPAEQIDIYPNPARDKFEVRSAKFEITEIEIYDLQGRILIEKQFPKGENHVEISVIGLLSGIYVCRTYTNNDSFSRKILIE